MIKVTTILGKEYELSELDRATVEHNLVYSQVLLWKDGKYIVFTNFANRLEAEKCCSELNIAIHQAHGDDNTALTPKEVTRILGEYVNFAATEDPTV